jgi:acetyl-CoA carboxylase biotin carboxyl carrier protein
VTVGQEVAILESMKMEIPAEAEVAGVVAELLVAEGDAVADGDPLMRVDP